MASIKDPKLKAANTLSKSKSKQRTLTRTNSGSSVSGTTKSFGRNMVLRNHVKQQESATNSSNSRKLAEAMPENSQKSSTAANELSKLKVDEPKYYCCMCKRTIDTEAHYRDHLSGVHNVVFAPPKSESNSKITNSNVTLDPGDRRNVCAACEKLFPTFQAYRQHLRTTHNMTLPSLKSSIIHRNVRPGVDNHNNYCRACERDYESRGRYRQHLRQVHDMTLKPLARGRSESSIIINVLAKPDPNDPNFYCRGCKKHYLSKASYHTHLRVIHNMKIQKGRSSESTITQQQAAPTATNPYCCADCKMSYSCKSTFDIHLQRVHQMKNLPSSSTH